MPKLREVEFIDLYVGNEGESYLKDSSNPLLIRAVQSQELKDDIEALSQVAPFNQSGGMSETISYDGVSYRRSYMATDRGPYYVYRKSTKFARSLADLNIHPILGSMIMNLGKESGLVLVSGGMGQGKTTTALASFLDWMKVYGGFGVTLEDPIEISVSERQGEAGFCLQVAVDHKEVNGIHEPDYATKMVEAMRWGARYIYLGEIRTSSTAMQALRAARNGCLVIATVHADDAPGTVQAMSTLIAAGGQGLDSTEASIFLGNGLLCVLHQKLQTTSRGIMPQIEPLIIKGDPSVQGKIRGGDFHKLRDDLQRQANQLKSNAGPQSVSSRPQATAQREAQQSTPKADRTVAPNKSGGRFADRFRRK